MCSFSSVRDKTHRNLWARGPAGVLHPHACISLCPTGYMCNRVLHAQCCLALAWKYNEYYTILLDIHSTVKVHKRSIGIYSIQCSIANRSQPSTGCRHSHADAGTNTGYDGRSICYILLNMLYRSTRQLFCGYLCVRGKVQMYYTALVVDPYCSRI